ncbi:MAG: phospholipase/lecithinase/hemolysin [Verrucomicrobiales bacterium]|jgi:phospholipase/lecithinase/hemolysin
MTTATKIITLSLLASIMASGATFDDYFFFGDSLTDTGNTAAFNGGSLGPGYPGTSVTNGLTWAKYLDSNVITGSALGAGMVPTSGSVDFSFAGATIANDPLGPLSVPSVIDQTALFASAKPLLELDSNDLAFVWGGGNDFLAADLTLPPGQLQASLIDIATQGSNNISTAVGNLVNEGVENVGIIKLINIGLAPRLASVPGAEENFRTIASVFNSQLEPRVQPLAAQGANITLIDADAFLANAAANPSAYGLTNTTAAAAPNADMGVPTALTEAEVAGYLFYDDIHPTTAVHQQFASFVSAHFGLTEDVQDANLVTDAALALDDRNGFETADLVAGQVRFNVGASNYENESGLRNRQTQGLRADLDFGVSDHMVLGAEIIYATGESGNSEFDSLAFGLDSTLSGHVNSLNWELGGGIGAVTGDLDRGYDIGTITPSGEHFAGVLTAHAAIQKKDITILGMNAYWELGLKERLVYRDGTSETGGGSLNLKYESETIATTIANLELGLELTEKLNLQIALNPVVFSSGGDISGSHQNRFNPFRANDATGYDVHTARAGLRALINDSTTFSVDGIVGDDSTWGASIGLSIDL